MYRFQITNDYYEANINFIKFIFILIFDLFFIDKSIAIN